MIGKYNNVCACIMEFKLRCFKLTSWIMGLMFCIIINLGMDFETKDGMCDCDGVFMFDSCDSRFKIW